MAEYIDREALLGEISETVIFTVRKGTPLPTSEMRGANKVIDRIKSAPSADVVEVRQRNTDDENCVICNSEIDEAEAAGLWDLSAVICNRLYGLLNYDDEQDTVYNIIRNYIESQNYCPNCGAKMDGKGEGE